jgi:hypothetical protein
MTLKSPITTSMSHPERLSTEVCPIRAVITVNAKSRAYLSTSCATINHVNQIFFVLNQVAVSSLFSVSSLREDPLPEE